MSAGASVVRVTPDDALPQRAWGTTKRTYRITDRGLARVDPEPLRHDIWDESLEPRWPPGSDYWPFKSASDVVVLGKAFGPGGRAVPERRVSAKVGRVIKRVQVFGTRFVEWTSSGRPRLGAPQPFTEMDLVYTNAYGGVDVRAPGAEARTFWQLLRLQGDHPGMYPRNQSGKGYLVVDAPVDGVELPNLEDPDHLLSAENVLVRDPARWYRQPLPWSLDWRFPAMFPRGWYVGAKPWFPVPTDEILEDVRRGFTPESWREMEGSLERLKLAPPAYYQEASFGMSFTDLSEGTPIELSGMHPEREQLGFTLPPFPELAIEVAGDRQPVEARLLHVVITPHEERVEITWAGVREGLPRAYFPGIHAQIPITLHADSERCPFDAPEPIYTRIKRIEEEGRMPTRPRPRRPGEPGYLEIMGQLLPDERPRRERDQNGHAEAPRFGAIDPAAGRLLLVETDWRLQGDPSFAFRRYYSSSMSWRSGALGVGWSHSLEQALWEEHGWVLYRMEDGREIGIPLPGGELGLGASVHHPNAGVTIVRTASDKFEARLAAGGRVELTRVSQSVSSGPTRARPTRLFGLDGTCLEVRYDTHGRLDRLLLPGGAHARFEHDERGKLSRLFVPTADGRDHAVGARYEVDESGQLREAVDGAGRSSRYRYAARLLVEHRSRRGLTRRFTYDGSGAGARCAAERWGDDAREVLFDPDERVAGLVDPTGASFSIHVADDHQVDRVLDRFANEQTRRYDEASRLVAATATPDGEATYLYDASWHLAEVTAPDQGSALLEHDALGRLTRRVDADGHVTQLTWDHLGRLAARVEPDGGSLVFQYLDEGAFRGVTLPGDRTVQVVRDPETGAVVRVDGGGAQRAARRDALGRVRRITDELGQATRIDFDAAGRVSAVRSDGDVDYTWETDANGSVVCVRDGSRVLTLERDGHGRLLHVDEGGAGPRLHRDADGRVTMVESEAFDYWELRRDAAGRVQEEIGFGGAERVLLRDHAGRVRRRVVGRARTDVGRDHAGRPTTLDRSDGTFQRLSWSPAGRLLRAQAADRVTLFERDGAGRVVRERAGDREIVSRYDSAGRRVSIESADVTVRVERDASGNATRLVGVDGSRRIEIAFERDAAGREIARALPGGLSLRWRRDAMGRPTRRAVRFGERELAVHDLRWRGASRVSGIQEPRGARDLEHDARGRLVRVGGQVRALDEVGRVYRSEARDDHLYEASRLIEAYGTTYAYDEAGRRVTKTTALGDVVRYRWDGAGRLVGVEPGDDARLAYDYDGLGRLVRRRREERVDIPGVDQPVWEPTTQTELVWDGLTLLHEITDGARTTWIWEAGQLVGKLAPDGAFAALTDHVGCVTELSDVGGDLAWRGSVDAFGEVGLDSARTTCPWRFRGHWEDPETGLAHSWLRVYDPATGAYLSPNPLGIVAGADLYGYVSDPLSETSPLGLGRGFAPLGGEVPSERLESEMICRLLDGLDRRDGALGPRARFNRAAAAWDPPDPEVLFWGRWESLRPGRRNLRVAIPQPRGLRGR